MVSSSPSSSSPANHPPTMCSLLVQPAPLLLSFPLNKITSQPPSPVNLFPPLFLPRSRLVFSRSGDPFIGSWLWWALGTRSTRVARDSVRSTSILLANREEALLHGASVFGRYKLLMEMKSPLGWDQRLSMLHTCLCSDSIDPSADELKIACSGESGVEDPGDCFGPQILLVNWKMADSRFVVMVSKLQIWCFSVPAICLLKLGSRGVKCITLQWFFCILKMRAEVDLAKDGDSCSFGWIHRWQVRESSLLIPRYNERGSFRMSSVMRLRNLQLIHLLPRVHTPARLPGESLALWRACTKEAFEDSSCGCASDLSQLTRHKTPVVVFPVFSLLLAVLAVFSLLLAVLVFTMCKCTAVCSLLESHVIPYV